MIVQKEYLVLGSTRWILGTSFWEILLGHLPLCEEMIASEASSTLGNSLEISFREMIKLCYTFLDLTWLNQSAD